MPENKLYYGDNLDILRDREYFPNNCVDLVYLDPPFNSSRSYNVLFKDESGRASDAQITAFEDTWHWGPMALDTLRELVDIAPYRVNEALGAMRVIIGENQMLAYLVMMTARLVELHRVLKPTGSLYLHCDPTASHYLKIILDTIFGVENFRNEITWKRTSAHSDTKQGNVIHMGRIHDIILFYTKTDAAIRNEVYQPYDAGYVSKFYRYTDPDGRRYTLADITGPGGASKGNPQYEFLGITRYWRYSKETMQALSEQGRIVQTRPGSVPRYKRYLDEMSGVPLQDVWTDINPVQSQAAERLNYPTQKPLALLERIIQASSNPGDVVLDPFCGCGTAIAAAHKLGRRWIGIDITHLSIALMKSRLSDMFELKSRVDYDEIGVPEDVAGAQRLAEYDRYQFQFWAVGLLPKAYPLGGQVGSKQGKKGSDKGIDGVISFEEYDPTRGALGDLKKALIQVKSGHVKSGDVRDLVGTLEREKAAIGIFITLEAPTRDMLQEALRAEYYKPNVYGSAFPRLQILTIRQLLEGEEAKLPTAIRPIKRADREKHKSAGDAQLGFPGLEES